ncbi:MAG: hypothetical protein SOW59_07285 [Corynebacterium sp.]|nr:hypothetical protein [Corynebacterium sp.]
MALLAVMMVVGGLFTAIMVASSSGGTGFAEEPNFYSTFNPVSLLGLVFTPFIYRLATREVDRVGAKWRDFGKDVHFWPTLFVVLFVGFFSLILNLVILLPLMLSLDQAVMSPGFDEGSVESWGPVLGKLLAGAGALIVVTLLINPLLQLMPWVAADGRGGFVDSIKAGFSAGLRNYLPLIGFNILFGIIVFFGGLLTLGLGLFILMPASILANAHLYRQAVGGPVPADSMRS